MVSRLRWPVTYMAAHRFRYQMATLAVHEAMGMKVDQESVAGLVSCCLA